MQLLNQFCFFDNVVTFTYVLKCENYDQISINAIMTQLIEVINQEEVVRRLDFDHLNLSRLFIKNYLIELQQQIDSKSKKVTKGSLFPVNVLISKDLRKLANLFFKHCKS